MNKSKKKNDSVRFMKLIINKFISIFTIEFTVYQPIISSPQIRPVHIHHLPILEPLAAHHAHPVQHPQTLTTKAMSTSRDLVQSPARTLSIQTAPAALNHRCRRPQAWSGPFASVTGRRRLFCGRPFFDLFNN